VKVLRGVDLPERKKNAGVGRRLAARVLEKPLFGCRRRRDEALHVAFKRFERERGKAVG
jgi:hypothetical protein